MNKNKKFLASIISVSFLFLIFKSVFGGIVYGIASFFTKKKLEEWYKKYL